MRRDQIRLPFPRRRYFLRREAVERAMCAHHLYHRDIARQLHVSACHWSKLVNRRSPLTPRLRRALVACPALAGIDQAELWDVVEHIPEVSP